jgi:hypothetical protein
MPGNASAGNSAIDAVKVCRKFCPPTGPSSPAQKNPATGISPSSAASSPASWSGSVNIRDPRPLQVNSRAPAAGRPPRTVFSWARMRRRSSSAEWASRTWNCTVWPTSTSSPTAMAPDSESAPRMPRTRKSPWPGSSAWYSLMTRPRCAPWASSSLSRSGSVVASCCRRVSGGRPPSSRIRWPSARVTVYGSPSGRQPWATRGCTSARARWAPTAPLERTWPSRNSLVSRRRSPPLAMPPMTIGPGTCSFRCASRSPAGNVNGSQIIRCRPDGPDPKR